jgi:hypothetical protein
MRKTVTLALVGALVGLPFVSGCTLLQEATCVDWVNFASPEATAEDADVIVVGTVTGTTESTTLYGVSATVHEFSVDQVLKGELSDPTILVTSTPETCTPGGSYPTGDPLDSDSRVELFLDPEGSTWRTITPWDGVVVVPDGGPLPWEPAPTP